MDHTSRYGIIATLGGVALFVTGLQKKVVNPVIGWIGLLGLLIAAFVIGTVAIIAKMRQNRAALVAALAVVNPPR